jgi:hypothetical protein
MKTAKEFEEAFDNNEDIDDLIDWSKVTRPNFEQKRVNLDLPKWMIDKLDYEAKRLGIAREAIMKIFLAEKIEHTVI